MKRRKLHRGTDTIRPLPRGTKVRWRGEEAVVLHDPGGNVLKVNHAGRERDWLWEYEGLTCDVVQTVHNPGDSMPEHYKHRQRIALEVCEAIERKWPSLWTEGFDVEEAREIAECLIPPCIAQAEAECAEWEEGIDSEALRRSSGAKSKFSELREILGYDDSIGIHQTICGAVEVLLKLKEKHGSIQ